MSSCNNAKQTVSPNNRFKSVVKQIRKCKLHYKFPILVSVPKTDVKVQKDSSNSFTKHGEMAQKNKTYELPTIPKNELWPLSFMIWPSRHFCLLSERSTTSQVSMSGEKATSRTLARKSPTSTSTTTTRSGFQHRLF